MYVCMYVLVNVCLCASCIHAGLPEFALVSLQAQPMEASFQTKYTCLYAKHEQIILYTCNVQKKGFTYVTALTRPTSQGPDEATNPLYGPWSSGCFSCLGQGVLCFKTIAGVLSFLLASAPQSEKLAQEKCRWRGVAQLETDP